MHKKATFTLAEVLITLAIVGVVAAMTIPTLLATISNKVKNSQITVITRKIQKGTDLLNINNGIGPYYNSTRAFLEKLSRHMKISTICDSGEDMKNCFPASVSTSEGVVDITKVTSGKGLGLLKDDYPDVAGVILGDGTPMIVAWNKNCPLSDPDAVTNDVQGKTYECLSGFMDLNGFKGANTISVDLTKISDIVPFNHASSLSESGCLVKLAGNKCIVPPQNEYKPMSGKECNQQKDKLKLASCYYGEKDTNGKDYFAGAVRACGGIDKMPSDTDIVQIAPDIYETTIKSSGYTWKSGSSSNVDTSILLGLMQNLGLQHAESSNVSFRIWISNSYDRSYAHMRKFAPAYTLYDSYHRYNSDVNVICIE